MTQPRYTISITPHPNEWTGDNRVAALYVMRDGGDYPRIILSITARQLTTRGFHMDAQAYWEMPARGQMRGHHSVMETGSLVISTLANVLGYLDVSPEAKAAEALYWQLACGVAA